MRTDVARMAVYFLRSKHISRSNGSRVTRSGIAGERIRNVGTKKYLITPRDDIAYKEIALPADPAAVADMAWAKDRGILWNAAEHAGRRCNLTFSTRVAGIPAPQSLLPTSGTNWCRVSRAKLADRYRAAVDISVHQPRTGADHRNQYCAPADEYPRGHAGRPWRTHRTRSQRPRAPFERHFGFFA